MEPLALRGEAGSTWKGRRSVEGRGRVRRRRLGGEEGDGVGGRRRPDMWGPHVSGRREERRNGRLGWAKRRKGAGTEKKKRWAELIKKGFASEC